MSPRSVQIDQLVDDLNAGRIGRRQFLARGAALGLSLSTVSAVLAACGGTASGTGGGDLHLAPGNVVTLDPAFVDGETMIAAGIFEGLVTFKPGTYDTVNQLAEKIEQSADGRQVSFALKRGIKFHHGFGEVTAEDVKFSFERIAGMTTPKVESYYKDDWQALEGVEVTGKYEGIIHLKHPYGPLFRTTLPVTAGWVTSKKAFEQLGPKKIKLQPVGTGKYQFKEVIPQQRSVLERSPTYSGASDEAFGSGKAAFKEMTFVYISGDQTLWAAMQTGELSYIDGGKPEADRLKSDSKFKIERFSNPGLDFIGMNTANPVLADVNVRRAIIAAIDRKPIIDVAYQGDGTPAAGYVAPVLGLGVWDAAPSFDQDLDAAQGFMEKAGVSSLSIDFNYSPDETGSKAAELVQGDLSKIGIKVNLKPDINFGTPGPQLKKNGIFLATYGLVGPDPSALYVWFTCSQVEQYNYMYWCDPRFTALYKQSVAEVDQGKRNDIFVKMAEVLADAAIILPVRWGDAYGIANSNVVEGSWRPDGSPIYPGFKAL